MVNHRKSHLKFNKKRKTRKYKGGAEYYSSIGSDDRDSTDARMESALGKIGISNVKEGSQMGWLAIGIGGIVGIGVGGYFIFKH